MSELPNDEILWKIAYIRQEGWVNMMNVSGVKDIANQIGWDDLTEWIEEEVEIGSGHSYDGEKWLKAATAASTGNRDVQSFHGTTHINLDSGGDMKIE